MKRSSQRKSRAQLDKEIAQALERRRQPRQRHHATMVATVPAEASWDVARDALLEHDPATAAALVRDIRAEHGSAAMPDDFAKAVRKVPKSVRVVFDKQADLVSTHSYDWDSFTEGATKAFWSDGYITEVENLESDDTRRALSPRPGGAWEDVLPDPPAAARAVGKKFTTAAKKKLTDAELNEIATKFSAEDAGYYGAMQALGHGVGWFDEGVDADPPDGFGHGYDTKLSNAIWNALKRRAREYDRAGQGIVLE